MSYPYGPDHPNAHEAGENESTPEIYEVYQEEDRAHSAIEVCVIDPVRTQELPARSAVSRSYHITLDSSGNPISTPILGADPRRKSVTLIAEKPAASTSLCMFVGLRDDVASGEAFRLPYGVAVTLSATEQLWAEAQGTGLTGFHHISVYAENWAD